ncbi:MAG: hypothetical protein QG657_1163 [Acidobacteriota bacterium]|nr:hypothetical protein [Acidobacteriota bacterium]
MKKKIVVVAYHIGRVGSSALMGILKLGGLNAGESNRLTPPAPMNPKGFFELKRQNRFLGETFKGFYPDITDPPPLDVVIEKGKLFHQDYRRLLNDELGDVFPYVVKAQRFLVLSFLHHLQQEYEIKVIVISRNEHEQVLSILRVWKKNVLDPVFRDATYDFVLAYIRKWKEFSRHFMESFPFEYYHVSFEDLIRHGRLEVDRIFAFIGEKPPSPGAAAQWLDVSLVNRPHYD